MAADPAPGVAVRVVAAGPATSTDVDVADFDPASAWGDEDEVTTAIPHGADFDPTSLGSAWGDGNDATTGVVTADPDGDEVTTATPDGAGFDPTPLGSAWGGGDGATAGVGRGSGMNASADDGFLAGVVDFDTPLAWGDNDEVTAAMPSAVDDAMVAAAGAAPCSHCRYHCDHDGSQEKAGES